MRRTEGALATDHEFHVSVQFVVSGLEMRMPTLGYRCTEDNGLSFELLVDGQPLGDLVGSRDTAFPYWIVEDGLPRWPPLGPSDGARKEFRFAVANYEAVCKEIAEHARQQRERDAAGRR